MEFDNLFISNDGDYNEQGVGEYMKIFKTPDSLSSTQGIDLRKSEMLDLIF